MQHVTVIDEYQHRNVESNDQSQDSYIYIMHLIIRTHTGR